MKKQIIALATITLLLFSCTNNASQDGHQHHAGESIALNKGQKWKVDDNMLVHIRNMEKDVAEYVGSGAKDYRTLAKKLQTNTNLLTSNCTMKGKAHDEMHKWLLPYIDLVNELSKTTIDSEAAGIVENLQESFITFNQYFL